MAEGKGLSGRLLLAFLIVAVAFGLTGFFAGRASVGAGGATEEEWAALLGEVRVEFEKTDGYAEHATALNQALDQGIIEVRRSSIGFPRTKEDRERLMLVLALTVSDRVTSPGPNDVVLRVLQRRFGFFPGLSLPDDG